MASERAALIGTRLRDRREELGWTRRQLANRLDGLATEGDLYRWETGRHKPQDDTLAAIARAMDRDYAWAVGERAVETPEPFEGTQLDRIERKLDRLLAALTPQQPVGPVPMPEGTLARVLEDDPPSRQAPARARRQRVAGKRPNAA